MVPLYRNRIHAGEVLLVHINERGLKESLSFVFGVPRGGVEVAFPISKDLGKMIFPLIVHKIPSSRNEEFAIGAISATGEFFLNEYSYSETDDYIQHVKQDILNNLIERQEYFGVAFNFEDVRDKEVLVVDDGIATGETVFLSVKTLLKFTPKVIYVAVPVSSEDGFEKLSTLSTVICPLVDQNFYAVSAYFREFRQLTYEETKNYIDESKKFEKRK